VNATFDATITNLRMPAPAATQAFTQAPTQPVAIVEDNLVGAVWKFMFGG
jgi:hypothetical protein